MHPANMNNHKTFSGSNCNIHRAGKNRKSISDDGICLPVNIIPIKTISVATVGTWVPGPTFGPTLFVRFVKNYENNLLGGVIADKLS